MKRALLIIPLVSGLIIGGVTMTKGQADNVPPIVQEVTHQGEVLENHEARITNTENDVKDLQTNTQTAPSPTRVVVNEVTTPPASQPLYTEPVTQPTPEPAPPVVVTSYRKIVVDEYQTDCELTYSDGTTYRWAWETTEYNQGTKITHHSDICDDSIIGSRKS